MTESLGRPRVEGTFVAGDLRAFDVNWAQARPAHHHNSYVDVAAGRMEKDGAQIAVMDAFSLGFPRRDRGRRLRPRACGEVDGDRLQARVRDRGYDVEGTLSGEYHLYGPYQGPFGFGR